MLLSAAVLKSSPEYIISSLPIIETTGLPVIIVWTQISAITKTFCSVFATVAVWQETNLSVFHTVLTKVMFPKCTSFIRCRKHGVERIIVSVYFFFLKRFPSGTYLAVLGFLSSLFEIFLIAWWRRRAVCCLCFELLFRFFYCLQSLCFHCRMPLIANLLLFPVSLLMFICNLSLHRKKRDFRDNLPLVSLNECAQSIFSAENETMIERLQSEPPVQQEGLYASLCPQSMMVIIH